jgi:phospholipid/cholesterol/gamma-HCH transport system substrate-binding protein
MKRSTIETVMGAVVLAIAGMFLVFAYSSANLRGIAGTGAYEVIARFDRVAGLAVGGDVRVSGIKVGTISSVSLDPKTYLAEVRMALRGDIRLPVDSVAEVASESLLGGHYMALAPGADPTMLKNGDVIKYTQSAVDLTQLLGKFIFQGGDSAKPGDAAKPESLK